MFLGLFNRVKTDLVRPVIRMCGQRLNDDIAQVTVGVRPSITASLIEHRDRYRLSDREMAFLAGLM